MGFLEKFQKGFRRNAEEKKDLTAIKKERQKFSQDFGNSFCPVDRKIVAIHNEYVALIKKDIRPFLRRVLDGINEARK